MFTPCECCGPCVVVEDDPNTVDHLSQWDQFAGSWSYQSSGTKRYETSSSDAVLINSVEPAPERKKLRWTVRFKPSAYGDESRVYFGWLDDSNHIVGRLTLEADCRLWELFAMDAGGETKIGEVEAALIGLPGSGEYIEAWIDWDGDILGTRLFYSAGVNSRAVSGEFAWTTEPAGMKGGVGTGTIAGAFQVLYAKMEAFRASCVSTMRTPCQTARDEFTRPNAAAPGCRWDVRGAAAYSIATNALVPTAVGDVIHKHDFPVGSHKIRVAPTIGNGGTVRLIAAWADDDNYLFGEIAQAAGAATTRVMAREAGVERQLSPRIVNETPATEYLLSYNGTRATLSGGGRVVGYAPGWTGTRVGLGAAAIVATTKFDNVIVESPLVAGTTESGSCQTIPLGECSTCTTFGPGRVTAALPGLTNGSCGACGGLAQSILLTGGVVPIQGFGVNYGFNSDCLWGYRGAYSFCGYDRLEVYVGFAAFSGTTYLTGFIGVSDSLGTARRVFYFRAATAAPYDCLSWNGLQLAATNSVPDSWSGVSSALPTYCSAAGGPMELWAEL